ncbi:MAG: hypothetical protein HDKAJFGB_00365 [Anaerolineae bacterium]|nr:hypothetical protein [Anaerolineae bacterium]
MHARGKTRQEQTFLQRAVAAADDRHLFAAKEKPVAGRAVRNAASRQFQFARHAQTTRRRARRNHRAFGFIARAIFRLQDKGMRLKIYALHMVGLETRAEFFSLLFHQFRQFGPGDAIGKPRIIFHFVRQRDLSAKFIAANQKRIQIRARRVQRGGQARRSRTNDNYVFCHAYSLKKISAAPTDSFRRALHLAARKKNRARGDNGGGFRAQDARTQCNAARAIRLRHLDF